jgi:Uma2 family endonuclease
VHPTRCGPAGTKSYLFDPIVAVEVLSPSTMDIDRGTKLSFYETLQTMQHIALVYQDQMRVERYRRFETGWERHVLTTNADQLVFDAVEFAIGVETIYFDVAITAR